LKQYQVTKKLQVTIPKKLAEKVGILPGDSVIFEEVGGEITLRKGSRHRRSASELSSALAEFASDLKTIEPHMKEARRRLNEDLSRHLRAQ
jgi:AbrB family looped-hinge helix DNA binding protein